MCYTVRLVSVLVLNVIYLSVNTPVWPIWTFKPWNRHVQRLLLVILSTLSINQWIILIEDFLLTAWIITFFLRRHRIIVTVGQRSVPTRSRVPIHSRTSLRRVWHSVRISHLPMNASSPHRRPSDLPSRIWCAHNQRVAITMSHRVFASQRVSHCPRFIPHQNLYPRLRISNRMIVARPHRTRIYRCWR